jgi:hypothetical protein
MVAVIDGQRRNASLASLLDQHATAGFKAQQRKSALGVHADDSGRMIEHFGQHSAVDLSCFYRLHAAQQAVKPVRMTLVALPSANHIRNGHRVLARKTVSRQNFDAEREGFIKSQG